MTRKRPLPGLFILLALLALAIRAEAAGVAQQSSTPLRRVNVPYVASDDAPPIPRRAVFWFGQVTPGGNYADARIAYNDRALYVAFHAFDQYLWYDATPAAADLAAWDAVSLYLDIEGGSATSPASSSYRFTVQLHNQQDDALYRSIYQGNGSNWVQRAMPVTTDAQWRGDGLNDQTADRGWVAIFEIPFSSLGLTSRPPAGTRWGLAAALHDRDDAAGPPLARQAWPEASDDLTPASWGELNFGVPAYAPPALLPRGTTTIRHGLNGAVVEDAHVGGHANCGDPVNPQFFSAWGSLNYAGYEQINIQNQWDVADWPCFSKFYITFPLSSLATNRTVLGATLTLNQFGNAEPSQALPSLIQVAAVAEDWDEATITWNNAPLAAENLDTVLVEPIPGGYAPWPGNPYRWDVSRAAAQAHASGQPLRLVLYSADGAYHSGKYFYASEADEAGRPALTITWGLEGANDLNRRFFLPLSIGGLGR